MPSSQSNTSPGAGTVDARTPGLRGEALLSLIYGLIPVLSGIWLALVSKYVPEPYLDEIFHIPQAQTYCAGKYLQWDDKITTPPGLYAYSVALLKMLPFWPCGALQLRATNTLALFALLITASRCRELIESISFVKTPPPGSKTWSLPRDPQSAYAVHTALNIALFPPLFFFSGLYYTDILSTCLVLYTYEQFLSRTGAYTNSTAGSVKVLLAGLLTLTLRQTNIFWVAIFMGGLEAVRTLKTLEPYPAEKRKQHLRPYQVIPYVNLLYSYGELHDEPVGIAGLYSIFSFIWSLIVSIVANIGLVLMRLWPYVALLISFAGFVLWNGGVVLGDKSNHIATIHVPQMLYIWPFFVFFSAPLLYPFGLDFLLWLKAVLLNIIYGSTPEIDVAEQPRRVISRRRNGSSTTIRYGDRYPKPTYWDFQPSIIMILLALLATLGIIHYNTIIHPFTLADNRHYVFYVFRYTILRHHYFKYALAPIYIISAWLVTRGLAGFENAPSLSTTQSGRPHQPWGSSSVAHPSQMEGLRSERTQPDERSPAELVIFRQPPQPDGNDTSWAVIWFLATALSLVTAPLVEPRYFIIPWVIWRLHVPAMPVDAKAWNMAREGGRQLSWWETLKYWAYKGHDHRLWLETAWFLAINVVTGWIFLFKGFEWPQEPGMVQRFLW